METDPFLEGGDKDVEKNDDREKKDEQEEEEESDEYGDDYVEKGKCCCCCSLKAGFIVMGVALLLALLVEVYALVEIFMNEYFDMIYGVIYAMIVFLILIAVIMQMCYWCRADSPGSRKLVPWGFLLASIAWILLIIWVIVYILAIFDREKVPSIVFEYAPDDEKDISTNGLAIHYRERKKAYYIFWHVIYQFTAVVTFLIVFFMAKSW